MAQERADTLVQLGTDDVFELAGLVVGLRVIYGEGVFEEALGQAVAADYIAGAASACVGELHVAVFSFDQLQFGHASENARWGFVGNQRQGACWSCGVKGIDSCGLSFFTEDPDLLEEMVEADFVVSGWSAAAVGGVR